MKTPRLESLTVEQLLRRFIEIGEAQDKALLDDDYAKYNQLYAATGPKPGRQYPGACGVVSPKARSRFRQH